VGREIIKKKKSVIKNPVAGNKKKVKIAKTTAGCRKPGRRRNMKAKNLDHALVTKKRGIESGRREG